MASSRNLFFDCRFSSIDAVDGMTYTGNHVEWCSNRGQYPNGMSFTTNDANNAPQSNSNCASSNSGGWWYNTDCDTCSALTVESSIFSVLVNSADYNYVDARYLTAAQMMIKLQ